jgi:hypothetical protein
MAAGIERAARAQRPRGARSSFGPAKPPAGGIYPTAGRGYGIAGEAAFPDLLTKWDKDQQYTAWRMGMNLALDLSRAAPGRFTAVQVTDLDPLGPAGRWVRRPCVLAAFLSRQSTEGRWTVAINPRGNTTMPFSLAGARQVEQRVEVNGQLILRLLRIELAANSDPDFSLVQSKSLIGELWEDSGVSASGLEDDDSAATIMLCVGIHANQNTLFFDASQYWKRVRQSDGRLILTRFTVKPDEPLITFRPQRHLTVSTILSCNCPSYFGAEIGVVNRPVTVGTQEANPIRGGQADGIDPTRNDGDAEIGMARRFRRLSYARLPSAECKHVHAVRWLLGAPQAEPSDGPTLENDYFTTASGQNEVEEWIPPLAQSRFLEQLRRDLLTDATLARVDSMHMGSVVADAFSVTPHRVVLAPQQLAPIFPVPFRAALGVHELRLPCLHHSTDPASDWDARPGDWWIGRFRVGMPHAFDGPGTIVPDPVINPLRLPQSRQAAIDSLPLLVFGAKP